MSLLQSFLNDLATESQQETEVDVVELLEYCIESKINELNDLGRFINRIDSSFESLVANGRSVTSEEIESFESDIRATLEYANSVDFEQILLPSFESSSDYVTEAEEKKETIEKSITTKIIAGFRWVLDKLKQLAGFIKKHLWDSWKKKELTIDEHAEKVKEEAKIKSKKGTIRLSIPYALSRNGHFDVRYNLNPEKIKVEFKALIKRVDDSLKLSDDDLLKLHRTGALKKDEKRALEIIDKVLTITSAPKVTVPYDEVEYSNGIDDCKDLLKALTEYLDETTVIVEKLSKRSATMLSKIEAKISLTNEEKELVKGYRILASINSRTISEMRAGHVKLINYITSALNSIRITAAD